MTVAATCPTCHAPIAASDRFCGACGADLTVQAKQVVDKRTMLGVVPVERGGPPRSPADPAPNPAPIASAVAAPAAPVVPAAPVKKPAQATMLGMAPPAAAPAPAAAKSKDPLASKSTMLGVAPALDAAVAKAKSAASTKPKKAAIPAVSDRTILGISPASSGAGAAGTDDPAQDHEGDADDDTAVLPSKAPPWRLGALIGGGILLVLGASALFWGRAAGLDVRVVPGAEVDTIEIRLPDAAAGSRVKIAGHEGAVKEGVGRVELAHDALRLGKNELVVTLIDGAGSAREKPISLELDYRARFDLSHLADAVPGADLILDAVPGSHLSVDGKPLALDAQGHAVKRIPVAPGGPSARNLVAHYRVETEGKPAVDAELKATLQAASLLLESPSDGLVTEGARVSVSGTAGADTVVSVDGVDAPLVAGHFQHLVALPSPGEHTIQIVARSPGKAPRALTLAVRRVADLMLAAASFAADSSVTYQALVQNPSAMRGKNVAFEGRVYNVEVQGGRTVLQMLASDCPRGQRCPLWVELAELSDAAKDQSVRVLGQVLGEQQFRSKQGAVQSVPSISAEFVLKRPAR